VCPLGFDMGVKMYPAITWHDSVLNIELVANNEFVFLCETVVIE
jgi:hypothetical protein|tara:strand:+ start:444 stop:575 length:132 start_codon:yes stop_codon:yes gene_type:complete